MPFCCVCNRNRPRPDCEVVVLTEQEKEAVQKMGQTPEEEYVYCRPCFRILSNPETGAQLIKGVLQVQLRQSGVANAEQLANRYYDFLIAKAKKKKAS